MIVYHGTTRRRAQRIRLEGFLPKKPSRKVWFAESRRYAEGRAKTQAQRAHDRPAILACEIDVGRMRDQYGWKRIFHRGGIIAIDGAVPMTVLRSGETTVDAPVTPGELASWINSLLRLKLHRGVSPRHPGIERLSRWAANRLNDRGHAETTELLGRARQWLPEYFERFEIDPVTLHARPLVERFNVAPATDDVSRPEPDAREDEALDCLISPKPRRRARGLALLAKLEDPDLFEWCVMFLDDESRDVRLAALHTMLHCEDGDPEVILPLADSDEPCLRAAATAALAKHAGKDASFWFERGLKDPSACVRMEVANLLPQLDPAKHRTLFELALYDPNPEIARRAEKLVAGKGYHKVAW